MYKSLLLLFIVILLLFLNVKKTETKYVISMTTIPSRINNIKPTIDSLRRQSIKPHQIIVNIPKRYERFDTSIHQIPSFLTDDPLIKINIIDEDYGPGTKMLGIFNLDIPKDMIVLICDDDARYKSHWAITLINGIISNRSKISSICPRNKTIFGNGGWGFYRNIIDETKLLDSYIKNKDWCNLVDDDFFTYYFDINNINCVGKHKDLVIIETINKEITALKNLGGHNSRGKLKSQCKKSFI